jgi:hypothetical protein
MGHLIYTYRDAPFNGRIYVKIASRTQYREARFSLFKNDQIVASKEANKKFAMFIGLYQAIAELTLEDGSVVSTTSSKLNIVIPPQPRPARTSLKKGTPHAHFLVNNVKRHFLEVNLVKGGFERLTAEPSSILPRTQHGR